MDLYARLLAPLAWRLPDHVPRMLRGFALLPESPVVADTEDLFERLGEVRFLAFVHLGEARARIQLTHHLRACQATALWEAYRLWRRAGRLLAAWTYNALMAVLFVTVAPLSLLVRRARPVRAGWRGPPITEAPRTGPDPGLPRNPP